MYTYKIFILLGILALILLLAYIESKSRNTPTATNNPKKLTDILRLERPLAFIDIETTGLSVDTDRIIELCLLIYRPDTPTPACIKHRIQPLIPIPTDAMLVHGITDSMVADCPTFGMLAPSIWQALEGCDLAGFNSNRYDIPLLAREFSRAGLEFTTIGRCMIDASVIFRNQHPRTLKKGYEIYCGKHLANAHDAEADARATIAILEEQIATSGLLQPTVSELYRYQQHGRAN